MRKLIGNFFKFSFELIKRGKFSWKFNQSNLRILKVCAMACHKVLSKWKVKHTPVSAVPKSTFQDVLKMKKLLVSKKKKEKGRNNRIMRSRLVLKISHKSKEARNSVYHKVRQNDFSNRKWFCGPKRKINFPAR